MVIQYEPKITITPLRLSMVSSPKLIADTTGKVDPSGLLPQSSLAQQLSQLTTQHVYCVPIFTPLSM